MTGYEYLDLRIDDLGLPGLFLEAGGWGRLDFAEETRGKRSEGDLQFGYLGWRHSKLGGEVRLGRVPVTGGVALNEVIDGLQFSGNLRYGFNALVFGGVPVETDNGGRSGDSAFGARLGQGRPGRYEIGVSYLKERDDSRDAREEAGVDLWARPAPVLALSGSSLYNVHDSDVAQHAYRLALGPFLKRATLTAIYGWVDYGAFFTSPDTSAFSLPLLDPEERLQKLGGELSLLVGAGATLTAEYMNYAYDILDTANAYGARLDWNGGRYGAGLAWRRSDSDEARLEYDDYRAYGTAAFGPLALALSLQEVRYGEEIRGTRDAFSVVLAADRALGSALSLGVDLEYGENPWYDEDFKGMFRLTWHYAATGKKGGDEK